MKQFHESMRYDYPSLTPDSWVIDVGAHMGVFSLAIAKAYHCNILAFEPIYSFWQTAVGFVSQKTKLFPCGVGSFTGWREFRIKGDMTGAFAEGELYTAIMLDVKEVIAMVPANSVDLIKLNIEGMEYEVLERIIRLGVQTLFRNIQVQFHAVIRDAEMRRNAIQSELLKTHELTYEEPFVWENWQLK